jgi:hypothetical protein
MQALAIVALVFASLSIFIPIGGVFIALLCSAMALIAFRSQTTLSGITFGINIINTAFLSPYLVLTDMSASGELDFVATTTTATQQTESGDIYWAFVGFHLVLFAIAIIWRFTRGTLKQTNENSTQ